MRAEDPAAPAARDGWATALLLLGVGLAVAGAVLPVIQVNGRSGQAALSSWEVLPWFAKLKFLALALLLAAAFVPRLSRWRVGIAVLAVAMVFIPALSAFVSALHAWGSLRPEQARLSGEAQPFVHPGLANLVLVAAGLLVTAAVWRIGERPHPPGEAAATRAHA